MFVIRNTADHGLFWDMSEQRWAGIDKATRFVSEEVTGPKPVLPNGGVLACMWEVDAVQFARLIAEVQAAGGFDQDLLVDVASSMDLDMGDVETLIDRACMAWDEEKEKIP